MLRMITVVLCRYTGFGDLDPSGVGFVLAYPWWFFSGPLATFVAAVSFDITSVPPGSVHFEVKPAQTMYGLEAVLDDSDTPCV